MSFLKKIISFIALMITWLVIFGISAWGVIMYLIPCNWFGLGLDESCGYSALDFYLTFVPSATVIATIISMVIFYKK